MLRPKLKSSGYSSITLPEFTAGINSRDAETSIKDNQLTMAENIFYSEGEFKTRNGFTAVGEPFDTAYICQSEAQTKVPWDWIYSKSHTLPTEHLLEERYVYNGSSWAIVNKGDFSVKSVYVAHNSFRNTLKSDNNYSNHVYGNVNTWLITDTCEKVQAYLPQSQPADTSNPVDDRNPGQLMFNYYTTRYMTYSGKSVKEKGLGLFLYICGSYGTGKSNQKFRLYELVHTKDSGYEISAELRNRGISYVWEKINDEEFYTPTVLVNGKGNTYSYLPANEFTEYSPQSMWENFNLMTPKFKAYFTTDGGYYTNNSGNKLWKGSRSFTIPWTVARVKKSNDDYVLAHDFKVTYTDNAGNENEVTIPAGGNTTEIIKNFNADGYYENEGYTAEVRISIRLYSQKATVYFWYNSTPGASNGANDRFDLPRGLANNLLFEGYAADRGGSQIIGDMGGCEWFGGNSEGIAGGTRLFLYGGEYEPNRLMWSDVDNPLYFPENNCIYIGDQGDRITKITKQSSMLVIFKRHSTHYTTYVDNSSTHTTEDVLNGLVSDISAISAIFPVTQISGEIGCDLPSTMQLCDNHLVWCNSDGRIYCLKATNQYSENNIYELSYPISTQLREAFAKLKDARISNTPQYSLIFNRNFISRNSFAVDYDGAYWLWIADSIFVMNYSDSGFKYAYSYREGNSVKRSIGFSILKIDSICRTEEANHTFFRADRRYSMEELKSLTSSQYEFSTSEVDVHYKSTGFIKGRNGLFFILEGKVTSKSNRSDIVCRSAQFFRLTDDKYTDSGMKSITESGNSTATVGGFKVSYDAGHDAPIGADFTTKLYDFGGNSAKKRIEHIYFDVFPKTDTMITVIARTEKGRELLKMVPVYKAEGTRSEHIRCNLHGVRRLALELSLSGAVAIGGFQIKYKNLGR